MTDARLAILTERHKAGTLTTPEVAELLVALTVLRALARNDAIDRNECSYIPLGDVCPDCDCARSRK